MNLKSERGVITELLTISIIVMLIVLGGFLLYTETIDKYAKQEMNTVVADEYKYNKIGNENIVENENQNTNTSVKNEQNTPTYNLDDILEEYTTSYQNTQKNDIIVSSQNTYTSNYNRYYYNQLNSYAKAIYDVIYENKEKLKSGVYSMNIPSYVSDVLYREDGKQLLTTSFQDSIDAFKADNPDMFYIAFNKIILITETTTIGNNVTYKLMLENDENDTYLQANFNSENEIERAINELESKKKEILKNATGNDYDKIKYIHNWLVENIEYDSTISRDNTHNIYGALIENEVVCDGYAKALKYLLDEINIPCIVVQGIATNSEGVSENHAWNYVRLYGKWYAIDPTWDDPIIQGWSLFQSDIKYKYFLKGSNVINQDHAPNGRISENGKEFTYPTLSYVDYE